MATPEGEVRFRDARTLDNLSVLSQSGGSDDGLDLVREGKT